MLEQPLDQTTAYARAVVEGGAIATGLVARWPHVKLDDQGRVLASRLVRAACERHLRDQKRADLIWDAAAAERGIAFFPDVLRLEGGKPFRPSPHQAFILGNLYGWKRLDGERRFRVSYVEVSKGDGKSPLAAGIGLKGLCAEGQERAEVYAAATKKDQAMILFRDAVAMRKSSPALARRLKTSGTGAQTWNLAHEASGSFFRPIASDDGQSGTRVYIGEIDELHEHKSSLVIDMMRAGTKGRRNALIFIITNSGFDRLSVCWREHAYSVKVLRGELEDDTRFAFIAGLDSCEKCHAAGHEFPVDGCEQCDDWRDEAVWPKAMPNLGITIQLDYVRDQVREAIGMPVKQNLVKRLNFCIWTEQASRAIEIDIWDQNAAPAELEQLAGQECWGGLDLASTDDLCALALLFPRDDESTPWPLYTHFWMCDEAFRKRANAGTLPWHVWREQGLVTVTPGVVTDYAYIRHHVGQLAERVVLRELAIDRWSAVYLITQLLEDGLPAMTFGQGMQDMNAPTKAFLSMLKAQRFAHGGKGMLRWQATNLAIETDAAGNMKPDKKSSGEKIDGIVASIMALGRALVRPSNSADEAMVYAL